MASNDIPSRWKKLSGEDKWDGLLSPLDNDLRRYIIHYGERTGAVSDLFDAATNNCKSSKENFFSEACLVKGKPFEYTVTDFFSAGSDYVNPAWFGYVALTTDKGKTALGRTDILVVWRGTITTSEWINNTKFSLTSAGNVLGGTQAKVHSGFLSLYTGTNTKDLDNKSAREQVRDAVRRLVTEHKDKEAVSITVTGFSLGAALATLNAMDIVANGYNRPTADKSFMVTAFVFASPRVGDSVLKQDLNIRANGLRLLRITNSRDPVPKVPPVVPPNLVYVHLGGRELSINTGDSPFLKWRPLGRSDDNMEDYFDRNAVPPFPDEERSRGLTTQLLREFFFSAHNMDVYLHGVAGLQNDPKIAAKFSPSLNNNAHDFVLVNKYLNRLLPQHNIPANWWEGDNRKKMEQQDDGSWKVKKTT